MDSQLIMWLGGDSNTFQKVKMPVTVPAEKRWQPWATCEELNEELTPGFRET